MSTPTAIPWLLFDIVRNELRMLALPYLTKKSFAKLILKFNNELTEEDVMSKRNRDSQQSKVYAAERAAFPATEYPADLDLEFIQAKVNQIWKNDFIRERFSLWPTPPQVKDGRARRSAYGGPDDQGYPRWSRMIWVVLHESAHSIHLQGQSMFGAENERDAFHGPRFCHIYLTLVERFMGFEARERLGAEFRKRRVKITK